MHYTGDNMLQNLVYNLQRENLVLLIGIPCVVARLSTCIVARLSTCIVAGLTASIEASLTACVVTRLDICTVPVL